MRNVYCSVCLLYLRGLLSRARDEYYIRLIKLSGTYYQWKYIKNMYSRSYACGGTGNQLKRYQIRCISSLFTCVQTITFFMSVVITVGSPRHGTQLKPIRCIIIITIFGRRRLLLCVSELCVVSETKSLIVERQIAVTDDFSARCTRLVSINRTELVKNDTEKLALLENVEP